MNRKEMRRFYLNRVKDESGISGTGIVAEGVVFSDGTVALRWTTEHKSVAFYESMETVKAIHGHGGKTVIAWHGKDVEDHYMDRQEQVRVMAGKRAEEGLITQEEVTPLPGEDL